MNLALALTIAANNHEGQVDKLGEPYILHVLDVVLRCKTQDERIVAALHDVVEDTEITLETLSEYFEPHIVEAVKAITKSKTPEPYSAYLARVKANPLALAVKIADIASNLSFSRLQELKRIDPATENRLRQKYTHALEILIGDKYDHLR